MEENITTTTNGEEESTDFTEQEAKSFFEQEIANLPVQQMKTRAVSTKNKISPGDFNALWERARKIGIDSLLYYDLPIETQILYKAQISIQKGKNKKTKEIVRVYQRLMVAKDLRTKKKAYYIVTFIPDPESKGKSRCENFMREKNHNNYSGLVLYLNPVTNSPIRVNRYLKGVKTGGVFLAGDIKDAVNKVNYAQELMGDVSISARNMVAARSLTEDDWNWNWDGSPLIPHGEGSWIYQGSDGVHEVIDTNGDGKPDTVVLPDDVVVKPGGGDGGTDITDPESPINPPSPPTDPDPTPDPGTGGGGVGGGGKPTIPSIKPNIKIPFPPKDFLGYGAMNGTVKMDCFKLADHILNKLLGTSSSDKERYALKVQGKNSNASPCSINDIVSKIDNHLDSNRAIKGGVDYRKGGNSSDGYTDHWVVINGRGYDSEKGQYYYTYIETGRKANNAGEAVGDNRLYYDKGKGSISGTKWDGTAIYFLNQIRTNK